MPRGSSQSSRSGWLELRSALPPVCAVRSQVWSSSVANVFAGHSAAARRTQSSSARPAARFLLTQRSIAAPPIQIFTQSACDAPLITRLIKRELRFAVHLPLKCAVCLMRNRSSPAVVRALAAGLTAGLRGRLGQPRAVWNWIELRQTCASDHPPPAHWLFPPKRQPSAPPKAREPPAQHDNPQA